MKMAGVALALVESEEPSLGLDLSKVKSFGDWLALGRQLASANKALNWWIGDWWAAGTHRYGARAESAAQGVFGQEYGALRNIASVCRAFEMSRRRYTLSFTHHQEVAALGPDHADMLLDQAEREDWSTRDLRAKVAAQRQSTIIPKAAEFLVREKASDLAGEVEAEAQRIGQSLSDFLAFLLALGWRTYLAGKDG